MWYKSGSSEKELYDMVLEVTEVAIKFKSVCYLINVVGIHLIACGIDVLSHGELDIGKLSHPVYLHLPLTRNPLQRSPSPTQWLQSWISESFTIAEPSDWFNHAQHTHSLDASATSEVWIWNLDPATALDALEELDSGRIKRHGLLLGVIMIPAMMKPEWFKKIVKVHSGIAGAIPECPSSMHEALILGSHPPFSYPTLGTGHMYHSWVD
jgi:hypothetical protein